MQYDNLPKELREIGKFCLWNYEERQGQEKPAKVPHQINGRKAQPNNEMNFTDYSTTVEVVNRYDGLGIGIFKGFSAIDIDHCINEDGTLNPLSKAIVDLFEGCYIEKSPSGKGPRILFKASGFKYNTAKYYINNINIGVEVYVYGATNKFVTVTGNVFRNGEILEAADKLQILLDRFMLRPVKKKPKIRYRFKWPLQRRTPGEIPATSRSDTAKRNLGRDLPAAEKTSQRPANANRLDE